MKISRSWLKDFVKISAPPQVLAERLTMAGLSVSGLERVGKDWVYDIEITSNRPDWLSVRGIAREVAAITQRPLLKQAPDTKIVPDQVRTEGVDVSVRIENPADCAVYYGAVIAGVNVGPSPSWMARRLESLGLRAVNNVVDITNYCLLEYGQPLHAFDAEKIHGQAICVRRARAGESIQLIDGSRKNLTPDILVVADDQEAVAVAGVMGGQATQVGEQTRNIFLESAWFSPVVVRRGARALGVSTDSSYRFERGVDRPTVREAFQAAARMITQICGGRIVLVRAAGSKKDPAPRRVRCAVAAINDLLNLSLTSAQMRAILLPLGFGVRLKKSGCFEAIIPSCRRDVEGWQDIAEEVARVHGYDRIPTTQPMIPSFEMESSALAPVRVRVKTALVGSGLREAVTYSLLGEKDYEKCGISVPAVAQRLDNCLSQDFEILRTSLIPSLLSVASGNVNHGQQDFGCFEVSSVYRDGQQIEMLGLILCGQRQQTWRKQSRAYSFYDLKGLVEMIGQLLNISSLTVRVLSGGHPSFVSGQSSSVYLGDQCIGVMGKVSEGVKRAWGIKIRDSLFAAELSLSELVPFADLRPKFHGFMSVPSITRDISLVVRPQDEFHRIEVLIKAVGGFWVKNVFVEELYHGPGIPEGCASLTISIEYGDCQKTLTEQEVGPIHDKVVGALKEQLALQIR